MPDYCSVFQTELTAILRATEYIIDSYPSQNIIIYSDSRASLMAIKDRQSRNLTVQSIQKNMVELESVGVKLTLAWVKAHVGIEGNERADILAKEAVTMNASLAIGMPAPLSWTKGVLRARTQTEWNNRWKTSLKGKWTREIFPNLKTRIMAGKIKHSFVTTQFLTGHGKFGVYLFDKKCRRDSRCRCGAEQDCRHVLFECCLLRDKRSDLIAECSAPNIQFELSSLPRIMAHPQLKVDLTETLNNIHRVLVWWESQDF